MRGSDTMSDSGAALPWQVIRQDDGGGSYRVGRYATQAEAQQVADGLDHRHRHQVYRVERVGQRSRP
ncbi:SPOR domain-containing protein [Streptomyces sp. 020-2-3H-GM]|uniref:SPOR domain-containing protein n=1 Tax=Streptomyces sp. 020-2-3H-GM TaxID=2789258 RepID=UPI00398078D5